MFLVALEAVLAGSKPPAAVSVLISTGERHGFGAAAPLSTMTSSLRGRVGGSWSHHQKSWSDTSGRDRPSSPNSYPHALLDLLQRPPHACEASCLMLRLPPWRDVVLKYLAQGLLAEHCLVSLTFSGFSGSTHCIC